VRDLRQEDFDGRVGEAFATDGEGGPYDLELTAVEPLPPGVREAGSFRLEWLGPSEPVLPQAIYTMRHGGDAFEIFLVPIASGDKGTRYEAIFN
jgi:hypothetical protein